MALTAGGSPSFEAQPHQGSRQPSDPGRCRAARLRVLCRARAPLIEIDSGGLQIPSLDSRASFCATENIAIVHPDQIQDAGASSNTISIVESTELRVDGVRLHALIRRGEPTILFLHGLDGLAKRPNGLVRRFDSQTMLGAMRALASTSRGAAWRDISTPTTVIRASDSVIGDDEMDEMVTARPITDVYRDRGQRPRRSSGPARTSRDRPS